MRSVLLLAMFGMMALVSTSLAATVSEEEINLLEEELELEAEFERQQPFCTCINPFAGTPNAYLGDPRGNCASTGTCYVPCNSDCRDKMPARGRGRCVSRAACQPRLLLAVRGG
jgi:hypothetical protein